MEILLILFKIVWLFLIIIGQFFTFVLKLIPVGLFLTLLENLVIGGKEIVSLILEKNSSMFIFMLLFIGFSGYIIIVGIIHLIININVFDKALKEETGENMENVDKFNLNQETVFTFRKNFLNAIMSYNDSNGKKIGDLESLNQSFFFQFVSFQGGYIDGKNFFGKIFSGKKKIAGFIILIIMSVLLFFALGYTKSFKTKSGEIKQINNGYDYIKNRPFGRIESFEMGRKINNSLQDSLEFKDRRIQFIAKLYYNTSLMKWLGNTELITAKKQYSSISGTGFSVGDSSSPLEDSGFENRTSEFFGLDGENLPDNGVYIDEYMKKFYGVKGGGRGAIMKSCMDSINSKKKLKQKYFIPEGLHNSRLYNQFVSGNKNNIDYNYKGNPFEGAKIEKKGNETLIQASKIDSSLERFGFKIPGAVAQDSNGLIGLYFIEGRKGSNQYIINKSLYDNFLTMYTNGTSQTGKTYTNPNMLHNNNSYIVDFCYGYSLLKSNEGNLGGINGGETKYGNFEYTKNDYTNIISKIYEQTLVNMKGKNIDDPNLLQLGWYFLNKTDFYLKDGFNNEKGEINKSKNFNNLNNYFYMFNKDKKNKNLSFNYLIGGTIAGLYKDVDSLTSSLEKPVIKSGKNIDEIIKSKNVKDVISKYLGIKGSVEHYHDSIISKIKKYDVIPNGGIFNDNSKNNIIDMFIKGYKQESGNGGILAIPEVINIVSGISKEVNENDPQIQGFEGSSSGGLIEEEKSEVLYFGKEIKLSNELGGGTQYQKVGALIMLFPIFESQMGFINYIIFLVYLGIYTVFMLLIFWFSGLGQFFYNFYRGKSKKEHNINFEFNYIEELKDLTVRFIFFIILMKIYFILTVF